MSHDPLSPSQREAIHELQMKHLRESMSNNERVASEIDALEWKAIRAWTVAFVALCLAAIFAVLFVRARAEKTSDLILHEDGTISIPKPMYCLKSDETGWLCGDDIEELEKQVAPEATTFGTEPVVVIL